jgi:hypothetical protein
MKLSDTAVIDARLAPSGEKPMLLRRMSALRAPAEEIMAKDVKTTTQQFKNNFIIINLPVAPKAPFRTVFGKYEKSMP